MVSRPAIARIDYNGYNAWDQPGFRAAALAGSDLASRIEDAAALVVANGYRKLVVPAPTSGLQKISRKIVLPANIGIDIQGIVQYTGSANEVAVEIGSATVQNLGQSIRVWVSRLTDSDWSTFANCGLLIHNLYNSHLDIQAEYFTLGAELRATNFGWSHNDVWLNRFTNCRAGLKVYTSVADTSWVNQNTFNSGRWQIESQKRSSLSNPAAGVKDPTGIWFAGNGTGINNNLFINPSFEISGVTYAPSGWTRWPQVKPWLIECGATVNTMIDARHENLYEDAATSTVPFLWVNSANVSANYATLGYVGSILWKEANLVKYMTADEDWHVGNRVVPNYQARVIHPATVSTWNSGPLAEKAKQGKSTGELYLPGAFWAEGNFLEEPFSYYTTHAIGADYIELAASTTEALGWLIDTRETKHLLVKANCVSGSANIRYLIRAFDSSGNALTSAGGSHPYVRFIGADWTTNLQDGYMTTTTGDFEVIALLGPDVAKIRLHLMQISASAAKIRSLSVSALDGAALTVSNLFPALDNVHPYATSAPASGWKGNWKTGNIVLNYARSASGDPWGWSCRGDGANFDALNP